jgi:hypothetical protein
VTVKTGENEHVGREDWVAQAGNPRHQERNNMATCSSCGKNMGLGIFSKWVAMDKLKFCHPCAEVYSQQRRQRVIEAVLGLQPQCLFVLPKVRTRNPDRPGSRERLIGLAAFTDKGICFVNLGKHEAADAAWGHLFGLLGAIASSMAASKELKSAFAEAEAVIRTSQDFADLLNSARQVFFYPRERLTKVKIAAGWFTLWQDKKNVQFQVHGTRKEFKPLQAHAKAYCDAVGRGLDLSSAVPPGI